MDNQAVYNTPIRVAFRKIIKRAWTLTIGVKNSADRIVVRGQQQQQQTAILLLLKANMEYDMICNMKVEELKVYLRLRALRISGKKAELVARVISAMENNVKPVKTAEEVEVEIQTEYSRKLIVGDQQIPDPFVLKDGWLSEEEGAIFWPMILYPDIFTYLTFNPAELASQDLSDYKSCKAYSYYKCGWLQAIQYNNVSSDSKYCILKADCRKSERINDPFHKLWIIVDKKIAKIQTAHCSCMAGLSETCNHVAAALFRVEAAVRLGLTNPACTSSASEWLPNRQEVVPSKVKDIVFNRDDFAQRGKKKRALVETPKRNYDPLAGCTKKLLSLYDVAKAIEEIAPNSILMSAVPKPKIDFVRTIVSTSVKAEIASIDDILLMSSSKVEFVDNMLANMTDEYIAEIEIITRGQSDNEAWFNFRKGVITASKAHDVLTKIEKVRNKKGGVISMWSLNQNISGLKFVNPDLHALKYGRTMEVEAINCFSNIMKEHTNFTVSNCGLYLHSELPYVGGSPDGIVNCDCCGRACLEIKCPFSINYTSPTNPDIKLPYLVKNENDKLTINKRHRYFTQCQVQMGVTNLKKSYFLVWSPHGHVLDCISFDAELWDCMKKKFYEYYNDYYLKSIFSGLNFLHDWLDEKKVL